MPKSLRHSLAEKGWSEEDIAHAENVFRATNKYSKYEKGVSPVIYWMGLLLAIVGNLIIAVFFIPFFLMLSSVQLYIVIAVMGMLFGLMFNFLLRDIEHVDYQHHIIAGIFIPVLSLITITIVLRLTNVVASVMNLPLHQDIWFVGFLYVFSFSAPYFVYKYYDIKEDAKKIDVETSVEKEDREVQSLASEHNDFASEEEAWTVYRQREAIEENKVHDEMFDKYKKYL